MLLTFVCNIMFRNLDDGIKPAVNDGLMKDVSVVKVTIGSFDPGLKRTSAVADEDTDMPCPKETIDVDVVLRTPPTESFECHDFSLTIWPSS